MFKKFYKSETELKTETKLSKKLEKVLNAQQQRCSSEGGGGGGSVLNKTTEHARVHGSCITVLIKRHGARSKKGRIADVRM